MALGHFPEGERVRESLAQSKALGIPFEIAWEDALHGAHLRRNGVPLSLRREETAEALAFAMPAFQRAYEDRERTRQDHLAQALLHAMARLYDSERVEPLDAELQALMEQAA